MAQRRRIPKDIDPELLKLLVATGERAPSMEDKVGVAQQIRSSPEASRDLDQFLIERVTRFTQAIQEAREHQRELRELLDSLVTPPWYPAVMLQLVNAEDQPRALVNLGGALRVVGVSEEVDVRDLGIGDEVYLGKEQNVVVGKSCDGVPRCGETGTFERLEGNDRLVIKHRDDTFIVAPAAALAVDDLRAGDLVRWDRSSLLAFERIERAQGKHLFLEETPAETFAGIGGLDSQIAKIQESILRHLDDPEMALQYGVRRAGGVVLVGPPGVGKTMIARAFCNWLATLSPSGRALFMNIKPGELHSEWYSATERNYREAFRVAREASRDNGDIPVVIFLDEIDAVAAARGSSHMRVDDRVVTTLATELEGLEERGNILVVAATNRRELIDPALLRPGRLGDQVIEVPRPNRKAALAIFARHLLESAPYRADDAGLEGLEARQHIIESAVSRMYTPNGDATLATVVFRDGTHRTLETADLVSGADIAHIANTALGAACDRERKIGDAGLRLEDILTVASERRETILKTLTPNNCRRYVSGLPDDADVVRIEPVTRKVSRPHRYLNAA